MGVGLIPAQGNQGNRLCRGSIVTRRLHFSLRSSDIHLDTRSYNLQKTWRERDTSQQLVIKNSYEIFTFMHRTIFATPVVNMVLRHFSVIFLRLRGWKIEGYLPAEANTSVYLSLLHIQVIGIFHSHSW